MTRGSNKGQSLCVGTISARELEQSGADSTRRASVRTGSEVREKTQQRGACGGLLSMKKPTKICAWARRPAKQSAALANQTARRSGR